MKKGLLEKVKVYENVAEKISDSICDLGIPILYISCFAPYREFTETLYFSLLPFCGHSLISKMVKERISTD